MRIRLAAVTLVVAVLTAGLLAPLADAQTVPATASSLIVKAIAGLTAEQQAEIVARNGGTLMSSIAALRLLVVSVPAEDLTAALARYHADPQVQSVEENKVRVSESVPSDLLYGSQWALGKIAWEQVFGVVNPTGSAKVALLDTGVDAAHPELADKILPGTSTLDGSNGMTDPSGHGTWLAGIIAAQTNTIPGDGIAGVAYAGVKILPVTVLNANGEGQDSDVIAGVIWAADHGADVILMAFSNPGFSPNLQDAIDYAWSKNVVVVAAVGNNASTEPTFPAGDRGVMGVAATDQSDALASFSNAGQAVFIAAPGVDIQTIDLGDAYTVISGTSTSAAIVAGSAALMKAVDPTLSNGIIVGRLARNADPAGTQAETGNGRVNLARALADTSVEPVQPAGAAPVGEGGPFVGPYLAAAASLTAITVGPQVGTLTYGTAGSVTFAIDVSGNGNGRLETIAVTGLPAGATFSPTSFPAAPDNCNAGQNPGCDFILTITTTTATPSGSVTFTVTVTSDSNNNNTRANTGTLTIGKKSVTASVTADNKIYDGTAVATISSCTVNGVEAGDTVTCSAASGAFANKNVGTGKTVTASGITLAGTSASKYQLSSTTATTAANITSKNLTVAGITASNKIYNGTTSATLNTGTAALVGVVSGDNVTLNTAGATGVFANKSVGTNKPVTISGLTLDGTDAGNYTLTQPTVTADITAKHITGSFTAASREYDGTTAATVVTRSLTGAIAGDDVSLTGGTATFADKAVGTNKIVTLSGATLTGADAGNYILDSVATATANVTAKHITGSFTASNKEYDGTTTAIVLTRSLTGTIAGDVVSLTGGTATFADKHVGTDKVVTLTGATLTGADAGNYILDSVATATANITAKHITGSFTASNKEYDGTTAATVLTRSLTGTIAGEAVTLTGGTATFADKNVGTNKVVTLTGATLTGADAANYILDSVATTTASITPKHITGSFTAANKDYDGTTAATVQARSLNGKITGDVVYLTGGTATFADKHVGIGKTVTLSGATLTGTDAGNYILDSVATATANITPKHITGSFTAANKEYDGTTAATVQTRSLNGTIAGDVVSLTGGTAAFADKNVGMGKTVTLTGATLTGTDAGNYILDSVGTTAANITAKHITGTFTASNKEYDGTTVATVLTRSLNGAIAGDAISLTGGTAAFADKNVGTNKIVTLTGASLSGGDAGNYILDSVATATADITGKHVTGSFTAASKVYDGTAAATVLTRSLSGAISGDAVYLTGGNATFADKFVGTGKIVTLAGAILSGVDAGNYILDSAATTTADITGKHITGSFTAASRPYDGTTAATVLTRSLIGTIAGDAVSLTGGTASFADKTVGTGKTVTLTGATLTGADAVNYILDSVATTTADITGRHVTGSFTAASKAYDGTTAATVLTRALNGTVAGDAVYLSGGTAVFADKTVGMGKTVTLTGATLTGADAANYILDSVATTTADITGRHITGSFTAASKVYDGTAAAMVLTRSVTGIVGSDAVSLTGGTATFADKNVGVNKVVTLTGATLAGADAGNYILDSVSTTIADITAKHVTGSFTASGKVYDGTTAATGLTRSLTGAVVGDAVSLAGGTATFADKNVGNKIVTLTGATLTGGDAGNYILDSVATTMATITQRPTTASVTAADKNYDGNTTATITNCTVNAAVSGDNVTCSAASAAFDTPNAGANKTVTATGITLGGTDAGNYNLTPTTATTHASILSWWTLRGFYQPVGEPQTYKTTMPSPFVWNTVKGGSTVPLKFNVFKGAVETSDIADIAGFSAAAVSCSATAYEDPVETQFLTTGGTSLRYSGTPGVDGQFIQNWATPRVSAQTCYRVIMTTDDGSILVSFFKLNK